MQTFENLQIDRSGLCPGATDELICRVEVELNLTLPECHKEFLRFADGAADDGFEAAEDALADGGGADDDTAHDAEVLADAIAFDGEGGGDGQAGLGVGERVHGGGL